MNYHIDDHIIESFKERYVTYPSIYTIQLKDEVLLKFVKKYHYRWMMVDYIDQKEITQGLVEYDVTGIDIYFNKTTLENTYNVYFLFKIDKQDVVEFTIHQLKKIK